MNLVMYLLVVALTNKPVMGEGIESIESYNCTKLLADAGCDDKGHLLDKYACLNSNYRQFKPPNSFTTVNIGWFLDMPKILDVKEKMGTIKIGLDETIFFWEDPRIKINFDNIENEKLHRVPLEPSDKFVLSIFPYNDICNPDTNENSNFKMWTPINQRINIHGELSREAEGSESLWGIQDYGLRFTEPLNESNPLMHMRMKLKVTIRCEFEHVGYPMDTQKCSLRIYSHRMQPLNIFFYDLSGICNEPEPTYERNGFLISSSCVNQTDGQNEIGIDFSLKRSINKYLFQYYLPSAIIVIVSQTSFFIPLSAIPGRIGLVVTQFLALTNIFINEQVIFIILIQNFYEINELYSQDLFLFQLLFSIYTLSRIALQTTDLLQVEHTF